MTVAAVAAGTVLALLGTRVAAVPLAAAAAMAASGTGSGVAGTWILATAAGLILVGAPVRRLVVPVLGAGGVLVAASASNVAGFLPAWTLGTIAAVWAVSDEQDRRWAAGLLLADVPVVAAVLWTVFGAGFVSWPPRISAGPGALLIAAALLRAPLLAGAPERRSEASLLVVRAQSFVLLLALASSPGSPAPSELDIATVVLSVGAAVVALSGFLARQAARDALIELGLVAVASAAVLAGWTPAGWAWGAMAAGTLVHLARAAAPPRTSPAGAVVSLVRGGGLGTPLLPVAAALVVAAAGSGGIVGATTVIGIGLGLAGRAWWDQDRDRRRTPWPAVAIALAALVAGLAAPLLSTPSPPAGDPAPWPGGVAYLVVAVGAVLGARFPRVAAPGRPRRTPAPPALPDLAPAGALRDRRAVLVPLVGLVTFSAGIWITGWIRGFL
jgi:hypothetical protein